MSNIKFTNEKSMDVEKDVDKSIESPLNTEGNVENTLENIDQDLSNIEDSSAAIDNLLNDPNLTEKERSVYRAELSTIKKDTSDFKNRLKKIGERVLESIGKGIGNTIEAYSYRFGENRKKIKCVEFVLDNLDIGPNSKIVKEFEEMKEGNNLWGIPAADFPLNDIGRNILRIFGKKKDINHMYDIGNLLKISNLAYKLNRKGISLEMISCLEVDTYCLESVLEDKELIEKMILLGETDFWRYMTDVMVYKIGELDLNVLNLLMKNNFLSFSFYGSNYLNIEDLNRNINNENIKKVYDFIKNRYIGPIQGINIEDYMLFCDKVFILPKGVQDICYKMYHSNGRHISDIIHGYDKETLDILQNLNVEQIALVDRLLDEGIISSWYTTSFKEYIQLNQNIFDRCKELSPHASIIHGHNLENLIKISQISDHNFPFFKRVYQERGRNENIAIRCFENMISVFGLGDATRFYDMISKSSEFQNFVYYAGDRFNLNRFVKILEMLKDDGSVDRSTFLFFAFGDKFLTNILDGHSKMSYVSVIEELNNGSRSVIDSILSDDDGLENTFINFKQVESILIRKNIVFTEEDKEAIVSGLIDRRPTVLLKEFSFPLNKEQKKRVIDNVFPKNPSECLNNLDFITSFYLKDLSKPEKQDCLDSIFSASMSICPMQLLSSKDFPFTSEQLKYVELFDLVSKSQSSEFKNLADQIVPMMSKYEDFDKAKEVLSGIEKIFLTNNIPAVGKQYKVFELMYNDSSLQYSVNRSFVESLKSLKENSRRRLTIFKDLLRSHISSCDSNLYSYLTFLSENRSILSRFESGEKLSEDDRNKIKLFIKKINVLSGHMGRYSIDIEDNISDNTLRSELGSIASSFGVKDGENIIDKFERTFLQRIGISSVEEALKLMDQYKQNAHQRNILNSSNNRINVKVGDFIKGMNSNFLDTYLDKGVYSPEFIGAETENAKSISKSSDSTPFDTDLSIFEDDKLANGFTGYGDMYLILKDKDQFKRDDLDIFKTGVINQKHYGIRTGFGSTNIDAICVGDTRPNLDKIKYFVAEKGFYIPICDKEGKVIFTLDEYNRYRDVFSGTHKSEKPIKISIDSVKNEEIDKSKQTEEGVNEIKKVKDVLINKIKSLLEDNGILFHKGEYEDSLLGAIITDTGSTGRGSALDEKFDFDFAVKLDDKDFSKVDAVISKLGQVFEKDDSYENKGMKMFRSKELEIDGHHMTIDVGFVKKSDAGNFDAHDALREKYDSIEKVYGKDKLLEVLTNIRFAKKKLKEAGCYKKGLGDNGQQGGLGGIGVEYWVLQNGGDAIKAFKDFLTNVYEEDSILSFDEFKKKYKIFSAGQNIRGGVKVENFVYNMSPEGYSKMIKLTLELTQ